MSTVIADRLAAGTRGWQDRLFFSYARGASESADCDPRRAERRVGCGLLLAGLLVLVGLAAVTAKDVLDHGRSLRAHLEALEQVAQGGGGGVDGLRPQAIAGVQDAGEHLAGMRHDLEVINTRVGPLLLAGRLLDWVPEYGGDLAAAADLLQVATGTTAAGDYLFQALSPALEVMGARGETNSRLDIGQDLLPVIVNARPGLEAAQRELAGVAAARARIDTTALSPRVAGLLERLDRYLPLLATGVDAALLAPQLLGAGGARTYLVIAQNNDELRATGGFISGVGELTIDAGRMASLTFDDSYAVDNFSVPHEVAPIEFRQVLAGDLWFFRDTNWDPDFPTSAARALAVYAQDRGLQADGVIALDLTALESLLVALGPVQVEGISAPVTGQNVVQVLQAQWANPAAGPQLEGNWNPEWWEHRKDFMGQVADAALDKLLSAQDVDLTAVARALMKALEEKHVLLCLAGPAGASDPAAARLLRDRNWDGALPEPYGLSDLLAVVDSNVGFNKADPNVARSIGYEVDLTRQKPQATLTLTYHNRSTRPVETCIQEARYGDSYQDMMERCYWDYARVYAPLGSVLTARPPLDLPPGSLALRAVAATTVSPISPVVQEGDWVAWPAFFALAPGADQTLTFGYTLPVGVLHSDRAGLLHYHLRIRKQPGTGATPLAIEITLPPGAELVSASPADLWAITGTQVKATTALATDLEVEIVFRKEPIGQ